MTQTLDKTLALSAVEYFKAKLAYEMTPYSLNSLLEKKVTDLLVLDVRSADMFNANHIPTALNIPLMDLAGKLATLPKDKTIVAYCGNLTCALAPKAALVLAEKGFRVMQLTGGMEVWLEKGFPVDKKA